MNCREVVESLSDYLDDDLDEDAADVLDIHLGTCPPCKAILNTLQRTVEFCRDTTVPPLAAELKATLQEDAKKALAGSGKPRSED
jgi:anti-sigma factor RsiW